MNDIQNNQELNMDDVNFDEFENFSVSEDMNVDTSGMGNMLFDVQNIDDMNIETTGDFAGDFSFDASNNMDPMLQNEVSVQEPYSDVQSENIAVDENSFVNEAIQSYQETPMVDESMIMAETPVVDETMMMSETPVVDETMIMSDTPVVDETMIMSDTPVVDETMMMSETPVVDETMMMSETPVVDETMMMSETPVVDETMIMSETPVVDETMIMSETPAVDETMMMSETPVVDETYSEETFSNNTIFDNELNTASENVGAYSIIPPQNLKYLNWYSGGISEAVYEFSKNSQSAEFVATNECKTIHVNVGYDTYGWVVQFSDGSVMSLRDVKEFQIRNGKLPNSSGRIIYGQNVLTFEKVERIVVYEAVRYFSYGV